MEGDLIGKPNEDSQFISFQDFSPINRSRGAGQAQLDISSPDPGRSFGNLGNDSTGIGVIQDHQDLPPADDAPAQRNFWTIEYYQKFFNVNTDVVLERLKRSVSPHTSDDYLIGQIRPNPDLYGPFWVCVTLIFSIAVSGNMANYLQTANGANFHWRYDFHLVSYAATCIFLYAWLLPILLWGTLGWTNDSNNTDEEPIHSTTAPGILELLCLYGYSLAIYIPIAFLWTIQINWLQWSLLAVATFLSGGALLRSLLPVIKGKRKPIYIAIILGMHILLAAGFMLYFFHNRTKNTPIPEAAGVPVTLTSTAPHSEAPLGTIKHP